MKKCSKCGIVKNLHKFHNRKGRRDGKRSECKVCSGASSKKWQQANRGRVNKKSKEWRENNKERYLEVKRAYREGTRDQDREYAKKYRAENGERLSEYRKAYREDRPVERRAWDSFSAAVRSGKVKRVTTCEKCGCNNNIHAHHDNYDMPFDVKWLCCSCHHRHHEKKRRVD